MGEQNINPKLPVLPAINAASMWRRVCALSAGTFREAIRLRVLGVTAIFALFVLLMSPYLPSDGSPEGKIRLIITVCLSSASVLAMFAALALSALLPEQGKKLRTDYMVAIRPVPRSLSFLARVIGIGGVIALSIFIMGVSSGIIIHLSAATQNTPEEIDRAQNVLKIRTKTSAIWESGASLMPEVGQSAAFILPSGKIAKWSFSLPPAILDSGSIKGRLSTANAEGLKLTAIVLSEDEDGNLSQGEVNCPLANITTPHMGEYLEFELPPQAFIPPEQKGQPAGAYIKLENISDKGIKIHNSPVSLYFGSGKGVVSGGKYRWIMQMPTGDARPLFLLKAYLHTTDKTAPKLRMLSSEGKLIYELCPIIGPDNIAMIHPPANLVSGGELIYFELTNLGEESVGIPTKVGLVLAKEAGSFNGAILKWMLIEFAKCLFVIVVTCAGAAILTFPIPALLGGVAIVGGYLSSFVIDIVSKGEPNIWTSIFSSFLRALLPDLAGQTVINEIANGEAISMLTSLSWVVGLVVLRCIPWGILGAILYSKKEIGA